jgi:DNA (cytosine-5)-methyltransferase 1
MKSGSLFSGYLGLDMAANAFFGAEASWVSDIDKGACKILAHHWPDIPNLGDITTVDWSQVEPVDILTGGFPCQDLSAAGKRAGMRPGTRSGLWSHMAYAIRAARLALDLGRAERRIAELEAAQSRVRALADERRGDGEWWTAEQIIAELDGPPSDGTP